MNSQNTMIHALILGAFSLGFGLLLAMTNLFTEKDIAARAVEDLQNSVGQVIPAQIHDNNPVNDTISLKNASGQEIVIYRASQAGVITGLAYEIHGNGFSGDIKLMLGVDATGKILGVRVVNHQETPGLGDRINEKKTDWILRFTGLSLGNPPLEQWKVKKDGGKFDQFSGATVTPRAVVGAIREGLEFFMKNKEALLKAR